MITYWTNFAKQGDPNGATVPSWPRLSETNSAVMLLGEKITAGPNQQANRFRFLERYRKHGVFPLPGARQTSSSELMTATVGSFEQSVYGARTR